MAESNNEEIEVINNLIAGSMAVKRVTVDNLNELTLTGKYYTVGNDSIQNKPEAGLYNNYITVMDVPYNNIVQTFTNLVSGKAYVRTRLGESTWSAWEPMCIKDETEQALAAANGRIDELEDKTDELDSKLSDGVVIATYSFNLNDFYDIVSFKDAFETIDGGKVSQSTPSKIILSWQEDLIKKGVYVPEGCHLEMTLDILLACEGYGKFYLFSYSGNRVTDDISFSDNCVIRARTKRVGVYSSKMLDLRWVSGDGNVRMFTDGGGIPGTDVLPARCIITYYVVKDY